MNSFFVPTKTFFLFLFALLLSGMGMAQLPDKPYNYINDYSNILTNEEERFLNDSLKLFEEKAAKKIYVLIMGSSEVEDYTEHTQKIAEKWRTGAKGKDNSILVAFYYKKRKIRIEVGDQLHNIVTDHLTADIISYKMTPLIKEGQYYRATVSGINALMQASMGKYKPQQDVGANQRRLLWIISGIAFVFCLILLSLYLSKYQKLAKSKNQSVQSADTKLEAFRTKWIPTAIVFGFFYLFVINYFTFEFFGQNIGFLIILFLFFILTIFFILNLIALLRKDGLNLGTTGSSNFGNSLSLDSTNH
jgi:uncharacterized membrane protein YgcG